jgi:Family of unknown function (DUF6152)
MKRNVLYGLLAASFLLWCAAAGEAHHSVAAEFDQDQPLEFTGTVERVEWVNPHAYTHVAVENDDGTVSTYRVQIGAPISLYRQGWKQDSVPVGTLVHFEGIRARNPASRNVNGDLTLEDGTRLWSGDGPEGRLDF